MDEGRLAAVKRGRNYNRKFAYVMNDIVKNRQEIYQHCLDQEMHESRSRLLAELEATRRSVFKNKILLQCLRAGKKWTGPNSLSPYGAYGGRPIATFSRDIDNTIAWNHPRLRRLRKVEQMKESCLKHGAILDPMTVRQKIDKMFESHQQAEALATLNRKNKFNKLNVPGTIQAKKGDFLRQQGIPFRYNPFNPLPDPVSASGVELKLSPDGNLMGFGKLNEGDSILEEDSEKFEAEKQKGIENENETHLPRVGVVEGSGDDVLQGDHNILSRHEPLPPIPTSKETVPSDEPSQNNSTPPTVSPAKQESSKVQSPEKKRNSNARLKRKSSTKEIKLNFSSNRDAYSQDLSPQDQNPEPKDPHSDSQPHNVVGQSSGAEDASKDVKGPEATEGPGGVETRLDSENVSAMKQRSVGLEGDVSPMRRAPTLVLPPIQSKKSDVTEAKRL